MVRLLVFLSLVLSINFSSFAEDVLLEGETVEVKSGDTLIRTSKTPKKVKLVSVVPYTYNVCQEYGVRDVYSQDPSCGYDTIWEYGCRNVCVEYRQCSSTTVGTNSNCGCQRTSTVCQNYPTNVMRTCHHPESYCIRYGKVVRTNIEHTKIIFRKLFPLQEGEQENFSFSIRQYQEDASFYLFNVKDLNSKYDVRIRFGSRAIVKD